MTTMKIRDITANNFTVTEIMLQLPADVQAFTSKTDISTSLCSRRYYEEWVSTLQRALNQYCNKVYALLPAVLVFEIGSGVSKRVCLTVRVEGGRLALPWVSVFGVNAASFYSRRQQAACSYGSCQDLEEILTLGALMSSLTLMSDLTYAGRLKQNQRVAVK
jgi:hypothetical protein